MATADTANIHALTAIRDTITADARRTVATADAANVGSEPATIQRYIVAADTRGVVAATNSAGVVSQPTNSVSESVASTRIMVALIRTKVSHLNAIRQVVIAWNPRSHPPAAIWHVNAHGTAAAVPPTISTGVIQLPRECNAITAMA